MTVYRPAKSPFFAYDFQFKGVRYHGSTGCTTKRDAERYEHDMRRRVALGDDAKPAITIDEACGLYWDERGQHERSSATTKGQLARLIEMVSPNKYAGSLTIVDLDAYVSRRRAMRAGTRKTLVSNATVNRELELLRRVMKFAASREYDVATLDFGRVILSEPRERVRELSADEEKRLFAELPHDLAQVAEFAMISGQRRTAVIELLWSRVDFDNARATVRTKGGIDHSFPLTPRLMAIIKRQPKVGPRVFTYECERSAPRRAGRPARLKGERYPFSKQGWMRKWRQALKDAKIEDFRFHDLRHTAGSRIVRASGNIKTATRLLGHTNIATTSRYVHVLEEDLRDAMLATESRNSPGPGVADTSEIGKKRKGNQRDA